MTGVSKLKIQWALSLLLVILYFSGLTAQAQYGGGTGKPNDPYLIYTAEQMNAIGLHEEDWDKHFKLMADIDLSAFTETDYNIIGYYVSWYDKEPFTGVFDGSGHTISNFSYTSADANGIGLFGYIDGGIVLIKDLGLINPNVNAGTGTLVGSLTGYNRGRIRNCYAEGVSVSGNEEVGGLVGVNFGLLDNCNAAGNVTGSKWIGGLVGDNYGTITKCYSGCTVLGNSYVAGLTGYNNGTIKSCYVTGIVRGSTDFTIGLVGYNVGGLVGWNNGVVSDCYSTSSVSGDSLIGGLVGLNIDTVTRCYSVGEVIGRVNIGGGLVGSNRETVTQSFWDIQTSGLTTSDGGAGKTTAEMQMVSTFMNEGWDFLDQPDGPHDIWAEPLEGGYPILSWQLPNRSGLPTFSGGTGEPDEPYLISTAEDLNQIGHNPRLMEEHFKLIDDIDLSGIDFSIIGSELYPFGGVFDGNGKKISNFTYTSEDEDFIGLFRYVVGATIKDLGLIDANVNAGTGSDVGALVGSIGYGDIRDCHIRNGNVSGYYRVGGLAGSNHVANINDCYHEGTVSGEKIIGGLVGTNHASTIENCSSVSTVNGVEMVGGLAGMNDFSQLQGFYQPGIIAKCCATGSITGQMCVGGLVGDNLGDITDSYATADIVGFGRVGGLVGHNYLWADENVIPPAISSCYASGSVFGMYMAGGLLGANDGGMVTKSFWDIETSGKITSDGGMGRTTSQMQMKSTFLEAGWDFEDETANGIEDIWWILEGQDYPRLWWELTKNNAAVVSEN